MPNYTYEPDKISENGVSRMRFELGDTVLNPGELTAALCDEEYKALIDNSSSWKKAKIDCLRAIMMKFAHQTDVSVKGVSYSFSKRLEFWKELLDKLETKSSTAVPSINPSTIGGPDSGHYFHKDMHKNRR